MRDPKRIAEVLEAVQDFWETKPDLRLGQIICLCCDQGEDPFYLEDDELLRRLKKLMLEYSVLT